VAFWPRARAEPVVVRCHLGKLELDLGTSPGVVDAESLGTVGYTAAEKGKGVLWTLASGWGITAEGGKITGATPPQ